MATIKSLENEMFLPVIRFSNCGTYFYPHSTYCISESSCSDINTCTSHLMLSLSVEKERENKARKTVFRRQVTARPDAFIHI